MKTQSTIVSNQKMMSMMDMMSSCMWMHRVPFRVCKNLK